MLDCSQALGDVIRNRRIELGLTQNQVADLIDVDVRTVLNIENHKGNPKMEIMFPLIQALNIDANMIFYPGIEADKSRIIPFYALLSECSEHELQTLFSICQNVVHVWRTNGTMITDDK